MSPLVFVLGMEYLSRLLKGPSKSSIFEYHSRCKKLGLNHLIFADDLMLLCKGDSPSIQVLIESINLFAQASGLHTNNQRSIMSWQALATIKRNP